MPAMNTERVHMNTWLVIAITVMNILFFYEYVCMCISVFFPLLLPYHVTEDVLTLHHSF